MKRNNKVNKNKRILQFVLMPILLFFLWIGLTFLYIFHFDTSLSVLSYIHGREDLNTHGYSKLLKGDKVSGTFTAAENNLGIVSVRFKTFTRPAFGNEDVLIFRIKEAGAKDWYYQNNYRVGLIYDVSLFPFGFPKIPDSEGKTYYFEIESLKGDPNNSVALSDRGQVLFSRYQAEKQVLLQDKKELISFAFKKFVSAILTTDVKFSSFIYFLPFFLYLLWMLPFGQSYKRNITRYIMKIIKVVRNKFYFIILGVIALDIFFIQLRNDVVYLVISFLWIAAAHMANKNSNMTFFVAICMLLIAPIFLLLDDAQTAEKGAAWAYIFLVAGLIQIMYELKREKQQKKRAILRK